MKEVDTHVDPEVVREVFGAIKESNTQEECKDLEEIFSDKESKTALNDFHPDIHINILHFLANKDHCGIIMPYLTKFIDTSLYQQRDYEGKTPVFVAIASGRLDNAKVLVESQRIALKEKGLIKSQVDKEIAATVNIQDNNGQTTLHRAADFHEPKHVEFLIANGADTKILDKDKNSALIYAVSGITSDVIKINTVVKLVKNSQELNIHGSGGQTALEILRETQKSTWGPNQERELIRACDRNKGICCAIS